MKKDINMKKLAMSILASVAFVSAGHVMADADASIEYRQSIYKAVKWHMDPLGAMARGDQAFDADAALHHARQVSALSHMPLEGFGEGTEGGGAKPEIWSNFEQFSAGMERFQEHAAELVAAAEKGELQALRPAVGQLGQTCRACHDNFRERQ
ncbi:cytochrome c [Nitrincola tibetensis]|uniref:Cytochrome c n=2 Tax=Nitrincola tibetensis TaxID=2219697 RepID=A0A364NJ73_9GAMM|nr:cytochrome c [Nitrincola tibetensis]